jgi:hypothetical protein
MYLCRSIKGIPEYGRYAPVLRIIYFGKGAALSF